MLVATFQLEHDAVALDQAFSAEPEMKVEAERIAAHSTEWAMPCLWIATDDFETAAEAIATDPTVTQIVESEEFGNEAYYYVRWTDDVEGRLNTYIDGHGSILRAEATAEGWEIQFRFISREQFDKFRESLSERGHTFTLLDLSEPGSPRTSFGELTPSQRDALVAAQNHGYYEVPREITTRELADKLDMAHQSLSELLRRGTGKLIDSVLTTSDTDDRE